MLQLGVGPCFTDFPIAADLFAESPPGGNLLLGHSGLIGGQKLRTGPARYRLSQAVVRAVAGLGILGARAARLATLDCAFGNRATAHRLGLSQLSDKLANTGRDFRESSHIFILRYY